MEKSVLLALNTVEEMVSDRKYINEKVVNSSSVFKRVHERIYKTPNDKYAITVFVETMNQLKNYSNYIENEEFETVICVYNGNTTIAHKTIEKNSNYRIEIFSVNSLLLNVTKHRLQPHVKKDVSGFKHKYKLPKISFYDPICRYYKFQPKDVIQVTSKTNGVVSYRIVV